MHEDMIHVLVHASPTGIDDATHSSPAHLRELYSPECVEGEFSEAQMQDLAYPPSYRGPAARSRHREEHKTKLHVVVVHKNSRRCISLGFPDRPYLSEFTFYALGCIGRQAVPCVLLGPRFGSPFDGYTREILQAMFGKEIT